MRLMTNNDKWLLLLKAALFGLFSFITSFIAFHFFHGCWLKVGKPKVSFRETIRQRAEFSYTHKKQSGGSGERMRGITSSTCNFSWILCHYAGASTVFKSELVSWRDIFTERQPVGSASFYVYLCFCHADEYSHESATLSLLLQASLVVWLVTLSLYLTLANKVQLKREGLMHVFLLLQKGYWFQRLDEQALFS
jgi:hypothetical protein